MDSLTQIVLGAACGEVALGKKLGNKAMLLGAIGGTIPDLDVIFGNLFLHNEIDKLAFHRGFMHSLLFAILAGITLAYLSHCISKKKATNTTTLKDWLLLWLLAIGTHPILDSFTPYGTQLLLPFSDYRVAFNNISVVDPLYTLPFLICLVFAMFFRRNNPKRAFWAKLGIYISSTYMLFTIFNKLYVDSIFEKSFNKAEIEYSRFSAQPTIFNNILWYGIAEGKDNYYVSFYSIFDSKESPVLNIPKAHNLLTNSNDLNTLIWFSNGYFNLKKINQNTIQYSDLRYPILNPKDASSSVFNFLLEEKGNRIDMKPFSPDFPSENELQPFWKRILGN